MHDDTDSLARDLDFDDPLTDAIMGAARLHTHDHTMAYAITREVLAVVRALPPRCDKCGSAGDVFMLCAGCQSPLTSTVQQPVAWRWQVHGIYHYTGGYPVSGAEPLYLRDASNAGSAKD